MATYWVCPIDGSVPADNGTDTSKTNNVLPSESDAVAASSGVIGSTSSTSVNVTTGANFHVGDYIWIPTRNEKMQVTAIVTNTLTVLRAQLQTVASGAIALNDVILSGFDINGNPPHCPLCGSAMHIADPATVTARTGVAAGSQHPADVDAAYQAMTEAPLAQFGATAYTLSAGRQAVQPHKFSVTNRGTATVTAETINTVLGP